MLHKASVGVSSTAWRISTAMELHGSCHEESLLQEPPPANEGPGCTGTAGKEAGKHISTMGPSRGLGGQVSLVDKLLPHHCRQGKKSVFCSS